LPQCARLSSLSLADTLGPFADAHTLMQIVHNAVATFHYTLRNAGGEILDRSESEPLMYLQGGGNIVPGLERQMAGKQSGDRFIAVVSPEEGYGVPNPALVQKVSREQFPVGVELEIGMQFGAHTPSGPIAIVVTAIEGEVITMDGNHPLAGETLHFEIEVVEVRMATEEELSHGHAHGPGGHHHH
jgi:FKBP-type peptidyl-prolyl cis-trans isomerase SlyD